jgi:hypothetical protein
MLAPGPPSPNGHQLDSITGTELRKSPTRSLNPLIAPSNIHHRDNNKDDGITLDMGDDDIKKGDELDNIQVDVDKRNGRGRSNTLGGMESGLFGSLIGKNDGDSVFPYSPYLLYTDPKSGKDMKYTLCKEQTCIGRSDENDVKLLSKYISRFQCRIDVETRNGEKIFIFRDIALRSKINGAKPIDHVLSKGDQIKLGKTFLLYMGECLFL